ncbi:MAG: putative acyl-CoA dehydrogenase [Friedmanniella sp.]|nr:putative acyl-CoA dehydrogenase [Friedmanniella sp.]
MSNFARPEVPVSHYRSNLRDIRFNLFELFGRGEILGQGPYADLDVETAEAVLTEVEHLARTRLADSFVTGDREPPVYDPTTRTVTLPAAFKASYRALLDAGFWRLEIPAALGGQPAPPSLQWAINELNLGANPSVYLYAAGPKFAGMVHSNGTERDRRIAQHMVDRQWGATMVLTEPDAGSDVGAGRTRALPQPDGTWRLEGVKRFITSGEHDLTENIVHLVLARPVAPADGSHPLPPGVGGPGTKGLSLFLVPKWHFDPDSGELTGERNGVFATNVEHKMGIRASTTCELTFGADGVPARGWLLGEVHDGIAQMFQVIEHARMLVGTKAIATLSTGYLNALDYARTRIQGADLLRAGDKTAPRVPILDHPDIRRSLLNQKACAEGLRSLLLYTASVQDQVALATEAGTRDEGAEAGTRDEGAERLNDLLLPLVKGYGSERSWVQLGTESLQTLGGPGFLSDYPLEQYVRDAKIDTLYEGTTAIQGQDLFFRKIVRDEGRALGRLAADIGGWVAGGRGTGPDLGRGDGQLKDERELLGRALADVTAMVAAMRADLPPAGAHRGPPPVQADPRRLYVVGLNTTRLLMALGDLVCGWLLLRGAEVALDRLNTAQPATEQAFYEGKVAAARWFARTTLPRLAAERVIVETTDLAAMDLAAGSF